MFFLISFFLGHWKSTAPHGPNVSRQSPAYLLGCCCASVQLQLPTYCGVLCSCNSPARQRYIGICMYVCISCISHVCTLPHRSSWEVPRKETHFKITPQTPRRVIASECDMRKIDMFPVPSPRSCSLLLVLDQEPVVCMYVRHQASVRLSAWESQGPFSLVCFSLGNAVYFVCTYLYMYVCT